MFLLCMKCKMQSSDNNAKVKKKKNKRSKIRHSSHLLGGYFISFMFPDIELSKN